MPPHLAEILVVVPNVHSGKNGEKMLMKMWSLPSHTKSLFSGGSGSTGGTGDTQRDLVLFVVL